MAFYFRNVKSDSTSDVSIKDPVADFASLPLSGNSDGDLRVTLDDHTLYVWDAGGSSWEAVTGSATNSFTTFNTPAGTDPVADTSSDTLTLLSSDSNLVITGDSSADSIDFTLASTITGDKNFSGIVSHGDLQILNTQSATALDNQAVPANLFSYAATNHAAVVDYLMTRNGDKRAGKLLVVTNGTSAEKDDQYVELSDLGIILSVAISGANVVVQYTSTNAGFNTNVKYNVRRWM